MSEPLISVIIPIYREELDTLQALCDWIAAASSEYCEWIIVSARQTPALMPGCIEEFSGGGNPRRTDLKNPALKGGVSLGQDDDPQLLLDWHPRVRRISTPKGRGKQMNAGARLAIAPLLVFLHADTRLSPGWTEQLINLSETTKDLWGAFSPAIDAPGLLYRLAEHWGHWRSLALGIPYGDQAIFITTALFKEFGGFDEHVDFMEELDLARRLNRRHIAPEVLTLRAYTSDRRWRAQGKLIYSSRNLLLFILFLLGCSRKFLKDFY